jgi:hypothetical protein
MYVCEVCGRKYTSPYWLERHLEAKHGAAEAAHKAADEALGGEVAAPEGARAAEGASATTSDADWLERACEALGLTPQSVISSHVYEDRVVLIEGPVGRKRVWWRATRQAGSGSNGVSPGPVVPEVEDGE